MKIKKIRKKKAASVIAAALVLFLAGNGAASLTHQCLSNFSPKKEQVENWGTWIRDGRYAAKWKCDTGGTQRIRCTLYRRCKKEGIVPDV